MIIDNMLNTCLTAIERSLRRRNPDNQFYVWALSLLRDNGRLEDAMKREEVVKTLVKGLSHYKPEDRKGFLDKIEGFGISSGEIEARIEHLKKPAAVLESSPEPFDASSLRQSCDAITHSLKTGTGLCSNELDRLAHLGVLQNEGNRAEVAKAIHAGISDLGTKKLDVMSSLDHELFLDVRELMREANPKEGTRTANNKPSAELVLV